MIGDIFMYEFSRDDMCIVQVTEAQGRESVRVKLLYEFKAIAGTLDSDTYTIYKDQISKTLKGLNLEEVVNNHPELFL